jgi:hypothetical protein
MMIEDVFEKKNNLIQKNKVLYSKSNIYVLH